MPKELRPTRPKYSSKQVKTHYRTELSNTVK